MTKRWKISLAAIVGLILLMPVTMHVIARVRLAAYRNELRKRGVMLDVGAFAPVALPNGIANGQAMVQASAAIDQSFRDLAGKAQRIVSPGKARVAWQQTEIIDELYLNSTNVIHETNVWPFFDNEFLSNKQKLETLRDSVREPLQFPIDYSKTYTGHLTHLLPAKLAGQNLSAATLASLHQTNFHDATEHLLALMRFVNGWKDEPLLISQLVRGACVVIASSATWETLQSRALSDSDLARLQDAWEHVDMLQPGIAAIAVERANFAPAFEDMRQNPDNFISRPHDLEGFLNRYPRYWGWRAIESYNDERLCLQGTTEIQKQLEAVRLGENGWPIEPDNSDPIAIIDFDRSFFPTPNQELAAFARSAWKFAQEQTLVSLTVTAIGLERYRFRQGHYPKQLTELVPSILNKVPVDYADGKSIRYKLNPDGSFKLYSVGQNGTDDGGDPRPSKNEKPKLFNGLDLVWPTRASAEEIQAHELRNTEITRKNTDASSTLNKRVDALRKRFGLPQPAGTTSTNN